MIIGIAIYITPVKKEKNIEGVVYSIGNYQQVSPITITLQGRYKKGLLSPNQFSGKVAISGYDITDEKSLMSTINFKNRKGNLVYSIWNESTQKMQDYFLGSIYTNANFTQFTILVNDEVNDINENSDSTWSESNGTVITAPASNADEAIAIASKLTQKNGLQLHAK